MPVRMRSLVSGGESFRSVLAVAVAVWLTVLPAVAADATGTVRQVWVWSDAHVGGGGISNAIGTTTEWLQSAVTDMRTHVGSVAFALGLGDVSNSSSAEELDLALKIEARSGFRPWWHIRGNHDHASSLDGVWQRTCGTPGCFTLADGNGIWICVSAERGSSGGRISAETLRWLHDTIASNQDRNVIVCTHQAVGHTVSRSNKDKNVLFCSLPGDPEPDLIPGVNGQPATRREATDTAVQRVEHLLDDVRVDLWLSGHIHASARDANCLVHKGRTTFINVASLTHNYNTGVSGSFVLTFQSGSKTVQARFRNHDTGAFVDAFSTTVEFPFPWQFSDPPVLTAR